MAITKEITIDINNNIPETMQDLRALKKELKNTAAGSAEFKRLTNEIDDLQDKLKSAKNTSEDWIDSMERQPGIMGMVGQSLNSLKVATQSWGSALKATGIGLIVGALGLLAGAFMHNDNMMKKVQPILDQVGKLFQGIFRAVEPLVDAFLELAVKALPYVVDGLQMVVGAVAETISFLGTLGKTVYKLITGDFKGAFNEVKNYAKTAGDSYKKTTKDFTDGTKEMTDKEKEELQKRLDAQKEAEAKRKELAEKRAEDEKRKREERIKAEEEARAKELELYNNFLQAINEADTNERIRKVQQADENAKTQEDAINALIETSNKFDEERKAEDEAELQRQKTIASDKVSLADNTMGLISEIAGKGSKIGKLIQAQELIRSGWTAVMNTFKSASASPLTTAFPAYPYLQAGLTGAFSALQLKNLMSEKKPSAGGSGSGGSGGGVSAPSFNLVQGTGINQIAQGLNTQKQPIKAYVVSSEVTTGQAMDRNVVKKASI